MHLACIVARIPLTLFMFITVIILILDEKGKSLQRENCDTFFFSFRPKIWTFLHGQHYDPVFAKSIWMPTCKINQYGSYLM
jgi:hypothetical protein